MLSEKEKNRILLEEQYRSEIKKKLDKDSKEKFNFFSFLNSNFGSFLLSTIIVGSISFIYNNHQDNIKNEEIRSKLFTEFSHRLNTLESITDTLSEYQSKDIYLAYYGSNIGSDPKINASYYNFRSYYPEYSDYTIIKVLDELSKFDNDNRFIKLKTSLIEASPVIINLGQSWFYQINSSVNLPNNVAIKFNSIQETYYYSIDGNLNILDNNDSFKRLWYVGNSDEVYSLSKIIEEFRAAS
ncbi:MAG: hypothetical protein RLN90_07740 [Balneolaceae bacterium]